MNHPLLSPNLSCFMHFITLEKTHWLFYGPLQLELRSLKRSAQQAINCP